MKLDFSLFNKLLFLILGQLIETFSTNELIFSSFMKKNSSIYKCIAENELGKIEKEITIKHYGKFNF